MGWVALRTTWLSSTSPISFRLMCLVSSRAMCALTGPGHLPGAGLSVLVVKFVLPPESDCTGADRGPS
jgi:hypothetical protein